MSLEHTNPCTCTIDSRTGQVVDYDCGETLMFQRNADGPKFDIINKAAQYNQHPSGVEAIDICRHLTGDWFNAFKYVFRAEFKGGQQDIEKAIYYINDSMFHDIPMHLPSWSAREERLTQQVIHAETDTDRKGFFEAIRTSDRSSGLVYATRLLEGWPS